MPVPEAEQHSFIIRLWKEEATSEGETVWRGHITHLPGEERGSVGSLEDVMAFMDPFLCPAQPRRGLFAPLRRWLDARRTPPSGSLAS